MSQSTRTSSIFGIPSASRARSLVVALVSTTLAHAPGHKTADPHSLSKPFIFIVVDIDRPNHCPPGPVRLGDDGTIWHNKPQHGFGAGSLWYAHAIVTVLGFPVGVLHDTAVGVRTATPPAAFELVKPRLERGLRKMSV